MLRFSLFDVPIAVHWLFWLSSAVIGGALGAATVEGWIRVAVFVAVVLISVLLHELGHALVARRFGARPAILLHGLGGLTHLFGARLTRGQGILVSLAGPMAGLALGAIVLGIGEFVTAANAVGRSALGALVVVNIGWSLFNLLPILPMDGGQVLRDLAGPRRSRMVRVVGLSLAAALCGLSLWGQQWFLAILFGVMAWQNYTDQRRIPGGVTRG